MRPCAGLNLRTIIFHSNQLGAPSPAPQKAGHMITHYHLTQIPPKSIRGGWKWSGDKATPPMPEPPAIGARVFANVNDLGPGTVTGYFIEAGYLGLYVKLDPATRPAWHKKQNPDRDYCMIFGIETRLL